MPNEYVSLSQSSAQFLPTSTNFFVALAKHHVQLLPHFLIGSPNFSAPKQRFAATWATLTKLNQP
jgi:fumarate hydratase class II